MLSPTDPTLPALPADLADASWRVLSHRAPLVHCLTNEVVQSVTANMLLAVGASPAMVVEPQEAAQFSALADALLINLGTLNHVRAESMLAAIDSANAASTPWTLDPVAVGALTYRTDFARRLLDLRPAAIRANASEVLALAGQPALGRGVDSGDDSLRALPAAQALAQQCGAIVAVTGAVDYITDGRQTWAVAGGDALLTRVVGTGCALSALVAGFTALAGRRLDHVAAACALMARAGERAAAQAAGPGTLLPHLLDALWQQIGEARP